jgi:hypothetical protein
MPGLGWDFTARALGSVSAPFRTRPTSAAALRAAAAATWLPCTGKCMDLMGGRTAPQCVIG